MGPALTPGVSVTMELQDTERLSGEVGTGGRAQTAPSTFGDRSQHKGGEKRSPLPHGFMVGIHAC